MPDERTCRTCWHWGVIEPGQGLCGHPDTGGAVHGADDTCCNHLAIVGRGGYWQPHEQLSGCSSPAEDWREPMVQLSSSSNPPEAHVAKHLRSGLTHGRLDALPVNDATYQLGYATAAQATEELRAELAAQLVAERADNRVAAKAEIDARAAEQTERIALRNRIAVLDVKIERLRNELSSTQNALACEQAIARSNCDEALKAGLEQGYARRWAAAWKRAAKRLAVGFLNERRAVEALAEQCASQKPQRMPWMGCPVPAPDGYPGCLLGGRRPDCVRCWSEWAREQAQAVGVLGEELETRFGICACDVQDGWEQHRGGSVVGACWAEWAQQQARARAEGGEPDVH